jgi:hypothetical protein
MVAEVQPQALVTRRSANDGQHVRQARASPEPGLGVDAGAKREDGARERLDAFELARAAIG